MRREVGASDFGNEPAGTGRALVHHGGILMHATAAIVFTTLSIAWTSQIAAKGTAKIYAVDELKVAILETLPPQAILAARGRVTSSGWTNGRLIPYVYVTPPKDGIYEFDFVADFRIQL